jgi:hypothetical protein
MVFIFYTILWVSKQIMSRLTCFTPHTFEKFIANQSKSLCCCHSLSLLWPAIQLRRKSKELPQYYMLPGPSFAGSSLIEESAESEVGNSPSVGGGSSGNNKKLDARGGSSGNSGNSGSSGSGSYEAFLRWVHAGLGDVNGNLLGSVSDARRVTARY